MSSPPLASYRGTVFPGLRPFRPDETVLFFGREENTDELLRRFEDARFLAVVGLSGSGKSSLVSAGLIPALRRGHLGGVGPRWRTASMRPGVDPLGALACALDRELGDSAGREARLRSGRLGLLDASRGGREADENLLLVVDQFEELFRFEGQRRERAHEAGELVRLILAATQEYARTYKVYVVITMRSDYLGDCAAFTGLPEALNESQYLVPRMTRGQLREAIAGPAALGGRVVAPDLMEELLDHATRREDQLPVLQHLLMRMWRVCDGAAMTMAEYRHPSVGGWESALNRHAEQVFEALSVGGRELAKRVFQRLTEAGRKDRESRRFAPLSELAAVAAREEPDVAGIVRHFREEDDCHFLTSPDADLKSGSVVDVTHESLIRRWDRLKRWTQEEAEAGQWYQRVEDRLRTKGSLTENELRLALSQKRDAGWNRAWAERYRTEKNGISPQYEEVERFLGDRERELEGERRRKARRFYGLMAVAAIALVVLVVSVGTPYLTLTPSNVNVRILVERSTVPPDLERWLRNLTPVLEARREHDPVAAKLLGAYREIGCPGKQIGHLRLTIVNGTKSELSGLHLKVTNLPRLWLANTEGRCPTRDGKDEVFLRQEYEPQDPALKRQQDQGKECRVDFCLDLPSLPAGCQIEVRLFGDTDPKSVSGRPGAELTQDVMTAEGRVVPRPLGSVTRVAQVDVRSWTTEAYDRVYRILPARYTLEIVPILVATGAVLGVAIVLLVLGLPRPRKARPPRSS